MIRRIAEPAHTAIARFAALDILFNKFYRIVRIRLLPTIAYFHQATQQPFFTASRNCLIDRTFQRCYSGFMSERFTERSPEES